MGAIKNWDHEKALRIIDQHIKVPLVTCEDFMMPYCVFGLTQTSKEQGTWAAETANKILQGTSPADIPFSRNHMTTVWINSRLAEKINFQLEEDLMIKARIEDAPHATRAAIEEGIVPGGGVALIRCIEAVEKLKLKGDEKTGAQIVAKSLSMP